MVVASPLVMPGHQGKKEKRKNLEMEQWALEKDHSLELDSFDTMLRVLLRLKIKETMRH